MRKKLLCLISLLVSVLILSGCIEPETPPTETPPDPMPYYDTDGDGISNAVETNPANAHHGFDTTVVDSNPSIAHGMPTNGWLEGGINLPDEGRGYYHYYSGDPVDTDDWGTLALVNMIEGGCRDYYIWLPDARGGFGDMSLQNGGYWPPHTSHQNGLDVDVRYVRNDGQEIGLDIASADSIYYDPQATADLMNSLIQNGNVTVIFIDTAHAHLEGDILQHLGGHSNHFHVRIEDPDGTGN